MAADAGARVINISLSTLSYTALDNAAAYARSKGALVIVAAGNSEEELDYSAFPNLIFVSGTDQSNNLWMSSTAGVGSVTAPASASRPPPRASCLPTRPSTWATVYGLQSGTSYSAALVSGAAALAWSIDPNLTPDQVQDLLTSTATDMGDPGWDEVYGAGILNVGGVAEGAYAMTPEPGTLALLAVGGLAARFLRRRRR